MKKMRFLPAIAVCICASHVPTAWAALLPETALRQVGLEETGNRDGSSRAQLAQALHVPLSPNSISVPSASGLEEEDLEFAQAIQRLSVSDPNDVAVAGMIWNALLDEIGSPKWLSLWFFSPKDQKNLVGRMFGEDRIARYPYAERIEGLKTLLQLDSSGKPVNSGLAGTIRKIALSYTIGEAIRDQDTSARKSPALVLAEDGRLKISSDLEELVNSQIAWVIQSFREDAAAHLGRINLELSKPWLRLIYLSDIGFAERVSKTLMTTLESEPSLEEYIVDLLGYALDWLDVPGLARALAGAVQEILRRHDPIVFVFLGPQRNESVSFTAGEEVPDAREGMIEQTLKKIGVPEGVLWHVQLQSVAPDLAGHTAAKNAIVFESILSSAGLEDATLQAVMEELNRLFA